MYTMFLGKPDDEKEEGSEFPRIMDQQPLRLEALLRDCKHREGTLVQVGNECVFP